MNFEQGWICKTLGDNGYSLSSAGTILLPGNPFVYPDNLPRVNATGGPEGRPGCWQKITKDLYPFPIWRWTPATASLRTTIWSSRTRC